MKVVDLKDADLKDCVKDSQKGGVVITQNGKPLVVLVGVKGLDLEQVELSYSDKFWKRVQEWRGQKTISREELEKRLAQN